VDERPLVSIVTPVLNGGSTIERTLASVSAQTYPNIEHIIVDGGSTDDTMSVVRSFSAARRLRVISEPDHGMYDAVNKGLAIADGDVLAYLNSDDAYFPWSVAVAVATLTSGCDFVYGDLGMVRGRDRDSFMPQFYPSFDLNVYTYFRSLGQPTVFWRRSETERLGGFDDSYRLIGDCEYWLRAATSGSSFKHVREMMAIQFDHPSTLRNTHRAELAAEFERLRATYRSAAGPPARWGGRRAALAWRVRFLRFYGSYFRSYPTGWAHFASWLKQHRLTPHPAALRSVLPAAAWPRPMSFTDAGRLYEALERDLAGGSVER
jgi:glycosyltransferase involved in cell wall biosynthesis